METAVSRYTHKVVELTVKENELLEEPNSLVLQDENILESCYNTV